MENKRLTFSQKHPFIFGFFLIVMAMVFLYIAMAFFSFAKKNLNLPFLTQKKIGIVNIKGTILNSKDIIEWLDTLKKDPNVIGIIIRLDSPGGAVAPSQEIYEAVKQADHVKPVIASMGSIAASGAYYISVGARAIVANPGTITGSIGVIAKLISFEKILKKIGIKDETITSGKFKDTGSPFRTMSQEEKRYIQNVVNDLYNQFVEAVASGRKMDKEKVKKLADGRVYTGKQAKELGLVDYLGNLDYAISILKKMVNIKEHVRVIEGPEEKRSLLQRLLGIKNMNEMGGEVWGFFYLWI